MTVSQLTAVIGAAASLLCTAAIGALAYFIKRVLSGLEEADRKNAERITQVEEKTAERIAQAEERSAAQLLKLDERSSAQIEKLQGQLNDLKSDMPLVYVLREDFIRSMNSVDHNISGLSQKIDQVLKLITTTKEG